jgi:hypothetical protein
MKNVFDPTDLESLKTRIMYKHIDHYLRQFGA